jgi:hypothetical protein
MKLLLKCILLLALTGASEARVCNCGDKVIESKGGMTGTRTDWKGGPQEVCHGSLNTKHSSLKCDVIHTDVTSCSEAKGEFLTHDSDAELLCDPVASPTPAPETFSHAAHNTVSAVASIFFPLAAAFAASF